MESNVHTWTEEALLHHGRFVRRLARTLVADENEAEELAQETWLVALRQAPADVEMPRSWLASVLRGVAFTRRRAERRRAVREEDAWQREHTRSADREAEELELQQRVVAAVLELDRPYRDVVLLRYYRGLSLPAIARRSASPLETVRTRLKRAHQLLREKLDREYGSRASWCVALAALGELREPAAVALGTSSLVTFGGLIMSWKYVAVAVALVAVMGIFWGLREETALSGPPREAPTPGAVAGLPVAEEAAPAEIVAVGETPTRSDAVPAPPPEDPEVAPPAGVWLVGRLTGAGEHAGQAARVIVDSAAEHAWLGESELEEHGIEIVVEPPLEAELELGSSFEVDVTGLFARGEVTDEVEREGAKRFLAVYDPERPIEVLKLAVFHERFLPLERRLELDPRLFERIRSEERVEIEVDLQLEPAGTTIEGIVTLPEGVRRRTIHVALFPFGFIEEGVPYPNSRQKVTCDKQGRFRMNVTEGGELVLVVGTDGHREPALRPETRVLEIELGQRLELPPIELTEGEIISGEVLEAPGSKGQVGVLASLVGVDRWSYILNGKGRNIDLKWIDGAFELASVPAEVGDGGGFTIRGLAPAEYELTTAEFGRSSRQAGEGPPIARFQAANLLDEPIGGMEVQAPAIDVTVDPRPDYAGFQVLGDGEPLAGASGRLVWIPRKGGMKMGGRIETDEQGRALIAIGKGMELDCLVVFSSPGWLPHSLVNAAEFLNGSAVFEPIELEAGLAPVTLRLLLKRLDGGRVDRASVNLSPWPEDAPRPDQREAGREAQLRGFAEWLNSENDEFRIEGLQPGRYWCSLGPYMTRGSAAPWHRTAFELVVPAKAEAYHTHELGPGCHVRVLGLAAEGIPTHYLGLRTAEGYRVHNRFGDSTDGAYQTTDALDPGEYVLRIEGLPGEYLLELAFTAVDGEVIELKPELAPR